MALTKDQAKKLLSEYEQTRSRNKRIAVDRKNRIYREIPRIKGIDEEIIEHSMTVTDLLIESLEDKYSLLQELELKLTSLKHEKLTLLAKSGYPKDYLEPIYTCSRCKDTGYIEGQKCTCYQKASLETAYQQSNLKDILSRENFNLFNFDYYSKDIDPDYGISPYENMVSIHRYCLDYVHSFNKSFSNLILYGHSGLGKTFLCNSIAKALLDQHYSVIYLTAFQLMRLFETYRFNKSEEAVSYEDIEEVYNCDLLIIDDLGSEVINSFTSSELFNCLNTRLLREKSTVISSNLGPSEWPKYYSNRIVSRIFGHYTTLAFFGEDIRLLKYN